MVEVIDLQPLRFLAGMDVLLEVVNQQDLVRTRARNKFKVFGLAVPGDAPAKSSRSASMVKTPDLMPHRHGEIGSWRPILP
jgi:hypothetical protein